MYGWPPEGGTRDARKLADKNIDESREGEEDTEHYRTLEKRFFQPPSGMKTGGEVIRAERPAEGGARALQQHRADDEDGEYYLHIGQNLTED